MSKPSDEAESKVIRTENLFGANRVVLIEHRGERYQLRLTQSGKLILTK